MYTYVHGSLPYSLYHIFTFTHDVNQSCVYTSIKPDKYHKYVLLLIILSDP